MSVTRVGELRLRRAAARSTASGWLLRHRLLHGLRGEGGSGEVVSAGQGEGGGGEGEVELESFRSSVLCNGTVATKQLTLTN